MTESKFRYPEWILRHSSFVIRHFHGLRARTSHDRGFSIASSQTLFSAAKLAYVVRRRHRSGQPLLVPAVVAARRPGALSQPLHWHIDLPGRSQLSGDRNLPGSFGDSAATAETPSPWGRELSPAQDRFVPPA